MVSKIWVKRNKKWVQIARSVLLWGKRRAKEPSLKPLIASDKVLKK